MTGKMAWGIDQHFARAVPIKAQLSAQTAVIAGSGRQSFPQQVDVARLRGSHCRPGATIFPLISRVKDCGSESVWDWIV